MILMAVIVHPLPPQMAIVNAQQILAIQENAMDLTRNSGVLVRETLLEELALSLLILVPPAHA